MKEKIAKLIDVKSLVTLLLTGGFIGLTIGHQVSGEQFLMIYTTVIAFYFGSQAVKNNNNSNNNTSNTQQ